MQSKEPTIELKDLEFFVVLASEKHFGKTAAKLQVSTAQVSQRIKRLEKELGGELLQRTTREVNLTELGFELWDGAENLLMQHRNLQTRVRERAKGQVGTVRLALNVSATYTVLPILRRVLAEKLPGVNIAVINAQGFTALLEEALFSNRVDMIVARGPLLNSGLSHLSLFQEPMVVIMAPNHHLASRQSLKLTELDGESLVSFPLKSASAIAPLVDQHLNRAGIRMHRTSEAEETTGLLGLVAAGLGVAIVPRSVSALHPGLKWAPLAGMPLTEMVLAWNKKTTDQLTLSVVEATRGLPHIFNKTA